MGIFTPKSTKAPHLQYPEIMHWQEGDKIRARNVRVKGLFSTLSAIETSNLTISYLYRGITRDGFIIVEEESNGEVHRAELSRFMKKAENLSFKNRSILSELETTNEYMELIAEFQKAYLELSDNDEKPKLLEV